MTTTVVSVGETTSYDEIVDIMVTRAISAVPVVAADGWVIGVVSEADLLHKIEFAGTHPARRLIERKGVREARAKAGAVVAKDLMSAPAVIIRPAASLGAAAALMSQQQVKRLPVVDDGGCLIGIVSRRDLLRQYNRPDDEILSDIREQVLLRTLWMDPDLVSVQVSHGIVTLAGTVEGRGGGPLLVSLVETVPGVVDVVDHLTYHPYDVSRRVDLSVVTPSRKAVDRRSAVGSLD